MRKVKSQFRLAACAVISFLTALSPLQQLTVGVNAEGESGTGAQADTTPVLYSYENVSTDANSLNGNDFIISIEKNDDRNIKRIALIGDALNLQNDALSLKSQNFIAIENAKLDRKTTAQNIIEFGDLATGGKSVWKFTKVNTDSGEAYNIELLNENLQSFAPKKFLKISDTTSATVTGNVGDLSVVDHVDDTPDPMIYVQRSDGNAGKVCLSNQSTDTSNDVALSLIGDLGKGQSGFHGKDPQSDDNKYKKWLTLYKVTGTVKAPELSTIPTLDTTSTGITTTMYDYDGALETNGDSDGLWKQHNGTEQNKYINNLESGNYRTDLFSQGIVGNTLDSNGLPVVNDNYRGTSNKDDGSLSGLFGSGKGTVSSNLLFDKNEYENTGWFKYNSNKNYAYFDKTNRSFSVYNQIGTPIYQDTFKNTGRTVSDSYKRGNFMPYNPIRAGKFSDFTNTADMTKTDDSDRENEVLYKTQPVAVKDTASNTDVYGNDYYFGMQVDVPSFYQPKDGKVHQKVNGVEQPTTENMVYSFSGDDDLWVFVDDVLVLDIGGIHGAISGNIDFATGVVKVGPGDFGKDHSNPAQEIKAPSDTSIYKRFVASGKFSQTQLDDMFKDIGNNQKIFKDYSMHSLKMFYMERGAGASDLDMRFNLQLPTKFTVKNTMVSNPDYSTYEKKDYRFQAMKKNPDGTFTPITSDYTKAVYVDDNGNETPVTFAEDGTFSLKLNQKVKFVLPDISDEYYVQEVGVDPDLIRRVRLKVNSAPDTELPGNNGTFSGASRKVADAETGDDLVFINEPVYRLKVVKEDGNASGKKLAGAVFNLGTQNGRVISGNLKTSDDKGVATENKERNSDAMRLSDGTYTLNETTAPDGYALMQGNLNLVIQDVPEKENAVKVSSDGKVPYGSLSYEKDSDDFTVYTITVRNYPDGVTPSRPLPPGNSSDQPGRKSLRHGKTSVSGNATGKQKTGSAESKAAPDTADHTGIMRWTGLLIGAIAVIGCVLGFRKKYSN